MKKSIKTILSVFVLILTFYLIVANSTGPSYTAKCKISLVEKGETFDLAALETDEEITDNFNPCPNPVLNFKAGKYYELIVEMEGEPQSAWHIRCIEEEDCFSPPLTIWGIEPEGTERVYSSSRYSSCETSEKGETAECNYNVTLRNLAGQEDTMTFSFSMTILDVDEGGYGC